MRDILKTWKRLRQRLNVYMNIYYSNAPVLLLHALLSNYYIKDEAHCSAARMDRGCPNATRSSAQAVIAPSWISRASVSFLLLLKREWIARTSDSNSSSSLPGVYDMFSLRGKDTPNAFFSASVAPLFTSDGSFPTASNNAFRGHSQLTR